MKTLSLLIGLSLLCLVAAEKKKDAGGLADKVSQLVDLSTKKSVIKLNGNKVQTINQNFLKPTIFHLNQIFQFRDFVKSSPRNYSIIVMFTALSASRQVLTNQNTERIKLSYYDIVLNL